MNAEEKKPFKITIPNGSGMGTQVWVDGHQLMRTTRIALEIGLIEPTVLTVEMLALDGGEVEGFAVPECLATFICKHCSQKFDPVKLTPVKR